MHDTPSEMPLATAIASLRDELHTALETRENSEGGSRVQFEDVEFELTLNISVETRTEGEVGAKFYVFNTSVSGADTTSNSHTITLRGKMVDTHTVSSAESDRLSDSFD